MKKVISVILILTLLFALTASALAAEDEARSAAQRLYELGLLRGRGLDAAGNPDFDLDSPATRQEAVLMLLRLKNQERFAEQTQYACPFTDVSDWAAIYVAFAYETGLVKGRGEAVFDALSSVTAAEYITMLLRLLYYHDESVGGAEPDFRWDSAWEKSDEIGLTGGEYGADTAEFTRADMVKLSARALDTNVKGKSDQTLFDVINREGFGTVGILEELRVGTFLLDGAACAAPALRVLRAEHHGVAELYVHMDDLWLLLAAASGVLTDDGEGSVSAAYTQRESPQDGETGYIRDYGIFSLHQYVDGAGMDVYARRLRFSIPAETAAEEETLSLTVSEEPRIAWNRTLYFNGGVRYLYYQFVGCYPQYVNADDFLGWFGFPQSLSLTEAEGGAAAWFLTNP